MGIKCRNKKTRDHRKRKKAIMGTEIEREVYL
jgi:hypothetical protein